MADMNMCNRFDFVSDGKVVYKGTQFTEYEDVEQPKQEEEKQPFSAASIVGNVLGAIAVGVVVGAAIGFFAVAGIFTGGAAWVVGAAIAGAVATTVAVKAVSQGVEDCKEGKTTSTADYLSSAFNNAVKVGGQITDGLDKVLFVKGMLKNAGKNLMLKAMKSGGKTPLKIPKLNPPKQKNVMPPSSGGGKNPTEPYNRRKHYGDTPKKSDRKEIGGESVDHDPPLVKRYYEGDPKTGEKPGYLQTPAERKASANDRSRMQPSTKAEQNKQGAEMSKYSKEQKKKYGL